MATLKFFLNKQKKDKNGLIPVFVSISSNSIRIRKAISPVKVKETDWKKDRVKPNGKTEPYNGYIEYNDILDKFDSKFKELIQTALLSSINIDSDYIYQGLFNNKTESESDFGDCFSKFLIFKATDSEKRTIMSYQTCYNKLMEFQRETNYRITFSSINLNFFDQFKYYILITSNYSDNYLAKLISNLKAFLRWAIERGNKVPNDYLKFKATERPKEIIALYQDELNKLFDFQFESKKLSHVRDVFCFACFTGLRYSDVRTIKADHIQGSLIIKQSVKTKDIIQIPILTQTQQILDRYKNGFTDKVLPVISEQKFNKYIKECCQIAGILQPTSVIKFVGGQKIEQILPKYQLITSHVARKTFISISLTLGINESIVKLISNHKSNKEFEKYVNISNNAKIENMVSKWDQLKSVS